MPVSMMTAADSANGSLVKNVRFCTFPFSRTVKSLGRKPPTNRPSLSFTVTGTSTRVGIVRMVITDVLAGFHILRNAARGHGLNRRHQAVGRAGSDSYHLEYFGEYRPKPGLELIGRRSVGLGFLLGFLARAGRSEAEGWDALPTGRPGCPRACLAPPLRPPATMPAPTAALASIQPLICHRAQPYRRANFRGHPGNLFLSFPFVLAMPFWPRASPASCLFTLIQMPDCARLVHLTHYRPSLQDRLAKSRDKNSDAYTTMQTLPARLVFSALAIVSVASCRRPEHAARRSELHVAPAAPSSNTSNSQRRRISRSRPSRSTSKSSSCSSTSKTSTAR